jgi:hypothetical protein
VASGQSSVVSGRWPVKLVQAVTSVTRLGNPLAFRPQYNECGSSHTFQILRGLFAGQTNSQRAFDCPLATGH